MVQRIKYLWQEEIERLFAVIRDFRDKAMFATIYHYGLRVSEASQLLLCDVDFCHKTIHIKRVRSGRGGERPLLSNTATLLKQYIRVRLPTGNALFTGRQGNLTPQRIQQLFKAYAKKAGLDTHSVHNLRHSIATHLLEAGFSILDVHDHMGHVNIKSTLIYKQIPNKHDMAFVDKIERSPKIVKF